jgi:hypothetical protein
MAMGGKRPKGNMEAVLLVFREKKKREIKGIFAGANDRTTPTHAHYVCVF